MPLDLAQPYEVLDSAESSSGFDPDKPYDVLPEESEGEKLFESTGKNEAPAQELPFWQKVWQSANLPIVHVLGADTEANEDYWRGQAEMLAIGRKLTPEERETADAQSSTAQKTTIGAGRGVSKLVDSFTSPVGLASFGLGAVPKLGRFVSGMFAVQAATQLPAQAKELKQAIDAGDQEKAAELFVEMGGGTAITALAGKHALMGEAAPPAPIRPESFTTPGELESLAARSRAILPRAAQAATEAAAEQPTIESEEQNASGEQETATVHGDVRPQPGEGEGQVPEQESGGGIQSQAGGGIPESAQGEVLLNQLKEIGDAPAGNFGKALKESGFPATTNWAYDMATRVSSQDIPALLDQARKADAQHRAALEAGNPGDQGMKGQFFRETVRMRQALDDAIAKGAQTDEDIAKIAGEHGVGAGLDPAMKAKELKAALEKAQPESVSQFNPNTVPAQEVPVDEIDVDEAAVPNFKSGANPETGVVPGQQLSGKYERLGTAPVVVWKRKNGQKVIITGRHRLDLAKRTGEKTIPAQVVEEARGFTKDMALTFDAEANIRDGQGDTEDYAQYFKHTAGLTQKEAESRGLLSRAKGKAGWDLARSASDDLYASWQAGKIGEAQALAITRAAPGNDAAQQIGLKFALQGKAPDFLSNVVKASIAESGGSARALDLFGRDDATMRAMEEQARRASSIQRQLREQLGAISGAAKKPEVARQLGVDVNDPEAVQAKVEELRGELQRWDNWPLHEDLVEQTRPKAVTKGGETIEKEKGQKEEGVLTPEKKPPTQPAAKAASEGQPAKSVTPPVAPAKTDEQLHAAISDAFSKAFESLKKEGWKFDPKWGPLELVLKPEWRKQFMFMGSHPHPTKPGRTLYEYKNGITRHYLRLDDEGQAYGYKGSGLTKADRYPPIPLDEAIDRSFEGLEEMGETRESKYNEEFIQKRNDALLKAGFSVARNEGKDVLMSVPKKTVGPSKPTSELFPAGETPFNLAGEKAKAPVEKPAESKTTYGDKTAAQQEMFAIQKIVEDKDPEKSANAAQQIAGGDPAKAAAQLRKQLQVVDSDPVTKRNFKKEQRDRLKEVVALLDQRASGGMKGMGGAVPGEFPTGPNPDIYGVAERVRQQRAAAGQVAPVPTGEGIGAKESVEHGRQLIAGGANPERVLANFEKTNRLSADDMAVVRAHGEQLALKARRIEEKFGTNSPQYRDAWTELSAWDTRTKAMQTEWHKTGQAQQGETDIDTGTFTGLQRAFKQSTGKDFTAAQATKAKATAKAVTQADATVATSQQKLFDELDRQAVAEGAKPGTPAANPVKAVWGRVRDYIKQGKDNFDEIRNKVATDLGMKVEQVTKLMTQAPRLKRLADDVWRNQLIARRLKETAKRWLTTQATPRFLRALQSIPRVLFSLKVGFHGTVALGTHAPMVAFQPPFWKIYAENFGKMYRMVGSETYYERQVQDLLRRPNYTTARRAGLINDPYVFEDYTSPQTSAYFGKITGMGNRGYSVLKMLRQDMFDQHWNQLPETSKIPEVAAAIADAVNHATGVVKGRAPKGANLLLFAPRLEASRAAWLAVDPARAGATFAHWKTASEAERTFAIHQVKEKAWVAGTMFGLLALNQGILSATGSKQKINVTDPMKSDFLKFKVAGMDVSYGNPMITMARLPIRLNALREKGGKGKLAHLIYPDESMSAEAFKYARTQLSPFASLLADVGFKGDYENRPLPKMPASGPRLPMPRRLAARGEKPYTWPEFTIERTLPIPAEDALRDVWKNGLGMSEAQVKSYGKAFAKALFMGATGARLSEDYDKKKSPTPAQ